MAWLRPEHSSNQPQSLTLQGRLPDDPKAEIRANFPDLNYSVSCRASELGQPGQPFKWTVQLPGKAGKVEMQTLGPSRQPVAAAPVPILAQTVQASPPAVSGTGSDTAARPIKKDPKREARQRLRRERHNRRRDQILLRRHRRR
ncbi:hypothetical protein JST97_22990 [bacterium]|nr:hypothetical protein [bacterium]